MAYMEVLLLHVYFLLLHVAPSIALTTTALLSVFGFFFSGRFI